MMTGQLKQTEDVIWRRIGDDIVVIKDDGLSTHILNKTAAFIWELCDGKHGMDEIAAGVFEHYDISMEEARADTRETIENLTRAGIVKYL